MIRLALLLLLASPATLATGQVMLDEDRIPEPWIEVIEDVTGDGQAERLRLTPLSQDYDVLTIEPGVDAHFSAPILLPVWQNRTGEDGIIVTSDTSFTIRTGCFACGRYHSFYDTKIAWRGGQFVVAGYTGRVTDRLFAVTVTCDINHLTGRGEVHVDGEKMEELAAIRAYPVRDWDGAPPAACEAAWAYESDSFLESWTADRDQ